MKDDLTNDLSYDRLNALVDGELDRIEEGRVLDAIQRDPGLEQQACALRLTKDLIRHAYQHESPARGGNRNGSPRGWRWMAVAAVALVAVGIGAGWTGHAWQQRSDDDLSRLAHRTGAATQVAATDRVVLHISSSAPERVSDMLDDAEGMFRAAREAGRPIAIEIVANQTGLNVLRVDMPGQAARLSSLRADNPNLTLVACGQTIERLRERGVVVQLLPETVVATSALDQIVKRIHEGWTYVRT